ncbi:MAG: hypothetical protein ACRDJ9_21085 [Dehalococcoidia bacterium]
MQQPHDGVVPANDIGQHAVESLNWESRYRLEIPAKSRDQLAPLPGALRCHDERPQQQLDFAKQDLLERLRHRPVALVIKEPA